MPPPRGANSPNDLRIASPAGIGDKGEARPIAEWRAAFAAVGEEVASADTAIRDAERKQRELDREIARLEQDRAQKPPSKTGSPDRTRGRRRDQSDAARDLCGAQRALDAALRRPSRHRRQGPQARARTGAPRRNHPKHRRGLVECRARRFHRAHRTRRQRARPEVAGRAISASAASDGRGVRSDSAMPRLHRPRTGCGSSAPPGGRARSP